MKRSGPLRRLTPLTARTSLAQRTGLRPRSVKRQKQEREYARLRAEFLAGHPRCAIAWTGAMNVPQGLDLVIPPHAATDVHHMRGRVGSLLLDTRWWLPLCRDHHEYVTNHPQIAEANGWSATRIGEAA